MTKDKAKKPEAKKSRKERIVTATVCIIMIAICITQLSGTFNAMTSLFAR